MTSVINPAEPGPVPGAADPAHAPHPAYPPDAFVAPPPDRVTAFLLRLAARAPRWLAPTAILACFAGATGYVLLSDPTDGGADAVPTCIVRLTTGFDCPGCGGTRAFFYLLHGNVPAAARHHLLFVFALPFLVYMYVAWAGRRLFGRTLPALRPGPGAIGVFLGAWLVFSVVRNLPWAPFTWLYV